MHKMRQLPTVTLFVLLCVGLAHSTDEFDLVLQHLDLLKSHVSFLKSQCQSSTQPVARDCADIQASGETSSGVYTVYIGNPARPTQVYCDLTTDGGRWLVFQRRRDGTVDFYRKWAEYSVGFGHPGGEFWLGNDALHWLTTTNNMTRYELRVDLADFNGNSRYAKYAEFKVASAELKYKLVSLGSFTGTAGDSLSRHKGEKFSTRDQDNDSHDDGSCAETYKGGWWYENCHLSNLNGLYLGGPHKSYADGVEWHSWTGYYYSLKTTEMKIRPVRI